MNRTFITTFIMLSMTLVGFAQNTKLTKVMIIDKNGDTTYKMMEVPVQNKPAPTATNVAKTNTNSRTEVLASDQNKTVIKPSKEELAKRQAYLKKKEEEAQKLQKAKEDSLALQSLIASEKRKQVDSKYKINGVSLANSKDNTYTNATKEEGIVKSVKIPRNVKGLNISIKVLKTNVYSLNDVVVNITINNKSGATKEFIFDKPFRYGIGPWHTKVTLTNNKGIDVLKADNRHSLNEKPLTYDEVLQNRYILKNNNWTMRAYKLEELVILKDPFETGKMLPSGEYKLQIEFEGIKSNIATFYMY